MKPSKRKAKLRGRERRGEGRKGGQCQFSPWIEPCPQNVPISGARKSISYLSRFTLGFCLTEGSEGNSLQDQSHAFVSVLTSQAINIYIIKCYMQSQHTININSSRPRASPPQFSYVIKCQIRTWKDLISEPNSLKETHPSALCRCLRPCMPAFFSWNPFSSLNHSFSTHLLQEAFQTRS